MSKSSNDSLHSAEGPAMHSTLAPVDPARLSIDTVRLHVRALAAEDADLYCELYTDPETMRFIGPPLSRKRAQSAFRAALDWTRRHPQQPFLALLERHTGNAVGICRLARFDPSSRSIEAGIILSGAARARGYAKEGLTAVVSCAFAVLPIEQVWVRFSVEHSVAGHVASALGFTRHMSSAFASAGTEQVWSVDRGTWVSRQ